MKKSEQFALAPVSRVNGIEAHGSISVSGSQAQIEAAAARLGWNARGIKGSRWYFQPGNLRSMIYVEYGAGGRVNSAVGRHNDKIEGRDRAGQIIALMEAEQ